mgnify:FL=1
MVWNRVVQCQEETPIPQPALLLNDRSHDIRHASEIAIVDLRRVYEVILRGIELR